MYITEAIECAKELHPNEYTVNECIKWCDELSADIKLNYLKSYRAIEAAGNELMLPQYVDITLISKVIAGSKELTKTDLNDFGHSYCYEVRGRTVIADTDTVSGFTLIYQEPYIPIRIVDVNTTADFSTAGKFICGDLNLAVGDIITLTYGGSAFELYITAVTVDADGDVSYSYEYSGSGVLPGTSVSCNIVRKITDETLCSAPYDTMYIDFLCAKIALYQGEGNEYQNFMYEYNTKAQAFAQYVNRNKPRLNKRFLNWL